MRRAPCFAAKEVWNSQSIGGYCPRAGRRHPESNSLCRRHDFGLWKRCLWHTERKTLCQKRHVGWQKDLALSTSRRLCETSAHRNSGHVQMRRGKPEISPVAHRTRNVMRSATHPQLKHRSQLADPLAFASPGSAALPSAPPQPARSRGAPGGRPVSSSDSARWQKGTRPSPSK